VHVQSISQVYRATENAGPGTWRTWKMTDQIAGLENTRPNHFACLLLCKYCFIQQQRLVKQCVVMPKNRQERTSNKNDHPNTTINAFARISLQMSQTTTNQLGLTN